MGKKPPFPPTPFIIVGIPGDYMNYKELVQSILRSVGGSGNVQNAVHCITRLRLTLKNPSLADTDQISSLEGVIKVANTAGQYQMIIGNKSRSRL